MGESRRLPQFGEVDLDLGVAQERASAPALELDLDDPVFESPASSVLRRVEDATRVMPAEVVARVTQSPAAGGDATRAGSLDEMLAAAAAATDEGKSASGSGSGILARDQRVAAMRELYASGDTEGALSVASSIAPPAPSTSSLETFDEFDEFDVIVEEDDFASDNPSHSALRVITPRPTSAPKGIRPDAIPRTLMTMAEISRLPIDHRAGFILTHVDGMQTVEEILDVSAMPFAEALELLEKLRTMGVIEFE